MTAPLPPSLVDGLLRLCQGDFTHRLPRTHARDEQDTVAFFFNAIAGELERIVESSREQERRLTSSVERLSEALIHAAAGDFGVRVERDGRGDPADVLAFLVDSTISELGATMNAAAQRADEERHRLERLVEERTRELHRLATTDDLSGALNRRFLLELAEEERARAIRYGSALCLAMLDLDHFKSVNDRHGHAAGDQALRLAAAAIQEQVRRHDRLGRYGGEEFALVLPQAALEQATAVVERIRAAVGEVALYWGQERVRLSVSCGVVQLRPGEALDDVLARADAALYEAKARGRNRVVAA